MKKNYWKLLWIILPVAFASFLLFTNKIKRGLDLQGGMYLTLEVDIVKLIENTARPDLVDDVFKQVIDQTRKESIESKDPVVDIFYKQFKNVAYPKGKKLSNYMTIVDVNDPSDDKIIENLSHKATIAIDQAREVIGQRINKWGVSETSIQKQGSQRIIAELPGYNDEQQVEQLIKTTGLLEFRLLKNTEVIVKAFHELDQYMKNKNLGKLDTAKASLAQSSTTVAKAANDTSATDTNKKKNPNNPYEGMTPEQQQKAYSTDHPFVSLFGTGYYDAEQKQSMNIFYINSNFPQGDGYSFTILPEMWDSVRKILENPEFSKFIPKDLELFHGYNKEKDRSGKEYYELYCLKKIPELTGTVITEARSAHDPTTGQPMVLMSMNSEGSASWETITKENIKKRIAIVLDSAVRSAPTVQNVISGGSSQITGMKNEAESHLLEIALNTGVLQAPIIVREKRVVGPSLGSDSINKGMTATGIAFALVILFMLVYYAKGGLVADFAVFMNIFMLIGVLAGFGGTLTLPGIAGIILTVAMAVDANILVFERIREELRKGRSLRSAIDEGFSKALAAVIDTHVTTFITGLILYFFGTGPIQGFALTLMIGIIFTFFTAIFISRRIIEMILSPGATEFNFGQPKIYKNASEGVK
ncbi:MAG: protein translocase subunit SecD [Candidatus Kapabacteria bacterium]|nr:protein translocase subunit SecD [Candidatus Kapabacteria bacterium]